MKPSPIITTRPAPCRYLHERHLANTRWPQVLIGCLLGWLLLWPCPAPAQKKPIPYRPIRWENHLKVNTSPKYRLAIKKDEAGGVADMRSALATARYEELWAYIPLKKAWIEIGCCERLEEQGNYIGVESYLLKLMAVHKRLIIYHLQTRTHFQPDSATAERRRFKRLADALPSLEDMDTAIMLTRRFLGYQPQGQIFWKICSRFGVTTYGVDRRALADEDLDLSSFFYFPWEEPDDEDESPPDIPASDIEAIRLACARLSQGPVRVSFTPHAD